MEQQGMTNLERELDKLKKGIIKMMDLVSHQMERAEKAFTTLDKPLAKEIHHFEKLVNASDLNLDKECENIIALYNPVASDLRFVLASLKIISNLERVGDHADKIARYVRKGEIKSAYPKDLLDAVKLEKMFDDALEMLETATQAFIEEDTGLARNVFAQDIVMNKTYFSAIRKMQKFSKNKDPRADMLLHLFSVINKLERVGDLAKNIAEETIFYVEAKIVKHRKSIKKLSS
jgi:phosphate transport system protein